MSHIPTAAVDHSEVDSTPIDPRLCDTSDVHSYLPPAGTNEADGCHRKICPYCRRDKSADDFIGKTGRLVKRCTDCRTRALRHVSSATTDSRLRTASEKVARNREVENEIAHQNTENRQRLEQRKEQQDRAAGARRSIRGAYGR
jgi:glutaredoxin